MIAGGSLYQAVVLLDILRQFEGVDFIIEFSLILEAWLVVLDQTEDL